MGCGVGGGFGPSSGRFAEACESSEAKLKMKTQPLPPAFRILAIAIAFLSFVFGATLIYENQEMPGAVLLIVAVTLVVLPVIWTVKNRR